MNSFNPRTRTGCDRLNFENYIPDAYGFNPRTRTGCDCAFIIC